ncbi:hypothetical protein P7K49_005060 [Saguinus oedipus]|uniref:Uncharacterized protein n=1 Tax=Saguinus oedipus TaxID=9490 RepID=A0ABQ9W973_SAGOE|nr:hypothetical protein P7K49_005060 [Saguinus oedipus]
MEAFFNAGSSLLRTSLESSTAQGSRDTCLPHPSIPKEQDLGPPQACALALFHRGLILHEPRAIEGMAESS